MPTIPPEQAPPPPEQTRPLQIHQHRQVAESFGTDAERYDRARPSYPGALVDRIVAASPGRDVLDVGCGTGISARLFQAAGCRVLGVDPDDRMASVARRGGLEVELAKFEDWDGAGREFDAVVAAQAWHWVDPAAGAAKAARVLRPGGRLAVFWNAMLLPPDLSAAVADVLNAVRPSLPFNPQTPRPPAESYQIMCDKAADGMRAAGAFGEPEQWRFDWDRAYTRDEWLDQVPTMGGYTRLPAAELDEVLAGMGAAIDALGGVFTMNYNTLAVTAARTGH
jgi:SAM-dependent methyltransferase